MRKIFSNFEQLPVNLSCTLFDTLLRPILAYNCEIWYNCSVSVSGWSLYKNAGVDV
jgi:hypothetical protein